MLSVARILDRGIVEDMAVVVLEPGAVLYQAGGEAVTAAEAGRGHRGPLLGASPQHGRAGPQ